jgi:hypothetical protein
MCAYVWFELRFWPHCLCRGRGLSIVIEKSVTFPPTTMQHGLPEPILQTDGVQRTSRCQISRTHYVFINAIAFSVICTSVKRNSGIYAFFFKVSTLDAREVNYSFHLAVLCYYFWLFYVMFFAIHSNLISETLNCIILCNVTPRSSFQFYQRFGETYCLHLQCRSLRQAS